MSAIVYRGQDFDRETAQAITDDIRAWAGTLWLKLKTAHDGRAYKAMGYSTWVDYLRDEFDISKSQGYRLLAHARTMDQLADAAGLYEASPIGDIPEGQTRDLDLRSVADAIAEQVHQLPHDATDADRATIVTKVIEQHKTTTETSTTVDTETGEILDETPADAPSSPVGEPADEAPGGAPPTDGAGEQHGASSAATTGGSGSAMPDPPAPLSAVPAAPAPTFASVGDLIDWSPDDGQWLAYAEMQRTESTKHFAGVMNKRIPRDTDQDIAELCPPEALRSAIFAAEVAATYWSDLAADLKKRLHQHPSTTDGRHLAAVEG